MQFDDDMKSEHKELFLAVRRLLIETHKLSETKKDRITTYSDEHGGICHLRTMKHGIDIGFLKGARMQAKKGELTGTGKAMRVLSLDHLDVALASRLIEQAIRINAGRS